MQQVENDTFFSEVDLLFAQEMSKKMQLDPKGRMLLAYFLFLARRGYTCLEVDQENIFPPPEYFAEEGQKIPKLHPKDFSYLQPIIGEEKDKELFPIIKYQEIYYLQKNWYYETTIVETFFQKLSEPSPFLFKKQAVEEKLKEFSSLTLQQKQAVIRALTSSLSIITGGPGTGKTHTLSVLMQVFAFLAPELSAIILAPTGKAATLIQSKIHMQEERLQIGTLHAFLYRKEKQFALRRAQLIVIDEASMIDLKMWAMLFEHISKQAILIFVGDRFQLPPIEVGTLFYSFCETFEQAFPKQYTELSEGMRTKNPQLKLLAQAACKGDFSTIQQAIIPFPDHLESLLTSYLSHFPQPIQENVDPIVLLSQMHSFCILTPLRKGSWGTEAINKFIYQMLAARFAFASYFPIPILITKNHYEMGIFNGDLGILLLSKQGTSQAYFLDQEKNVRVFSPAMLPKYEYAYALSVHKSQGSEFEKVVTFFPAKSEIFGKEILYTALTRAKKEVTLFTDLNTLRNMLRKEGRKRDCFGLRLIKKMENMTYARPN